jgi:hypothetical protein
VPAFYFLKKKRQASYLQCLSFLFHATDEVIAPEKTDLIKLLVLDEAASFVKLFDPNWIFNPDD